MAAEEPRADLPRAVDVLVVGSGYAGIHYCQARDWLDRRLDA